MSTLINVLGLGTQHGHLPSWTLSNFISRLGVYPLSHLAVQEQIWFPTQRAQQLRNRHVHVRYMCCINHWQYQPWITKEMFNNYVYFRSDDPLVQWSLFVSSIAKPQTLSVLSKWHLRTRSAIEKTCHWAVLVVLPDQRRSSSPAFTSGHLHRHAAEVGTCWNRLSDLAYSIQ